MTTKAKPENRHRLALRKARVRLNRRKPEEWRMVIDAIADPILRVQAACIVWWDYFGGREVPDRWPHLDDCLKAWRPAWEIDQPRLEAELLKLGFHPQVARTRSTLPATSKCKLTRMSDLASDNKGETP